MNKLFTIAVIFSLVPLQALISYTDKLEASNEDYALCMTEEVIEPCSQQNILAQYGDILATSILQYRLANKKLATTETISEEVVKTKKKKTTPKRKKRARKKATESSLPTTSRVAETITTVTNNEQAVPLTYGASRSVTYDNTTAYTHDPYPHNTATYASTATNDELVYGASLYSNRGSSSNYSGYRPAISGYSYRSKVADVTKHRKYLTRKFRSAISEYERNLILEDAGSLFVDAMLNHIMPSWYGTPWNFYGHTNVPNQGTIACGYLVSTTLKHLGVNVNRYTLAQQWPINMVQSLVDDSQMGHHYDKYGAMDAIRNQGYGFYIIGLDNHVGFIKYDQHGMSFIHSNYDPNEKYVVSENPEYSKAFGQSQNYYIGALSNNKEFIAKWLKYGRFRVVKG